MDTSEEKHNVKLFNEVQRNYNALIESFERHPALLCYFRTQLESLLKSLDEIEKSNSTLSKRLAADIRTFVHDINLAFFGGYKRLFAYSTEEHYAIDDIFEMVDEFRYIYPIEVQEKPQQKASKPVQKQKELPKELMTDEAKKILESAVNAGLCVKETEDSYKWIRSISLLIHFIRRCNDELEIKAKNGNENWKIWSILFNEDNNKLRQRRRSDLSKGVYFPRDAQKVDDAYQWKKNEILQRRTNKPL